MLDLNQMLHSFTCYVDSIHRLLKPSYNSGSETKKTRQASGIQMLSCSVEKLDLIWISGCSRNQTQEACPLSIPPYLCLQQRVRFMLEGRDQTKPRSPLVLLSLGHTLESPRALSTLPMPRAHTQTITSEYLG